MLKVLKYRLLPTDAKKVMLDKTFGCVRYYWNNQVNEFNNFNKETTTFKTSTEIRNSIEWMQEVSAAAIQQKEIDFKEFKKQYFSKDRKAKIRRPHFKSKYDRQSFRLPNQKFSIKDNKIRLEKIGQVKYVCDRLLPENSRLMSVTVSKDTTGKYFASVLVETEITKFTKTGEQIGIDVGLKEFATLSNGEVIKNERYFRKSQAKLRIAQRRLSRKKKGSSRRKKAKLKVARLHKKVANQRTHFLQTLTTSLVKRFDTICVEDLNVAGMIKNKKLAKSIADASFSQFFSMLKYKCEWHGKDLIKIYRFTPSSKTCSSCGHKKEQLKLSERTFKCEKCGHEENRDLNAAKNINAFGVAKAKRA